MFRRKVYDKLLKWKNEYSGRYACLLEGARRVGKTTIAEEFAKNEYQTYVKIDFSNISEEVLDVFRDLSKLDLFFLRLQMVMGIQLIERNSVIIFDEIQLYPKARQAIKHLVADGRYDYIETGSLISIKKNVKDILIPSEEYKIQVHPMDYEEFLWATTGNSEVLNQAYLSRHPMGNAVNRAAVRDFRIYMAVGGMPQAVDEYIRTNDLDAVDRVKREIINLYLDDLKKIDSSGRLSAIYKSVPSQLALGKKRFMIRQATGKQKTKKDDERIFDLIDSKIVVPCFNVADPNCALSQTKMMKSFKLYVADTGLFTTMLFMDHEGSHTEIYKKLLSHKLEIDLGYLYENAVAQMITADERELYYHTWKNDKSTHEYEIDFLIAYKNKIIPVEVKSSQVRRHTSIDRFMEKYSSRIYESYLVSNKDVGKENMLKLLPLYMVPFLLKRISQSER